MIMDINNKRRLHKANNGMGRINEKINRKNSGIIYKKFKARGDKYIKCRYVNGQLYEIRNNNNMIAINRLGNIQK